MKKMRLTPKNPILMATITLLITLCMIASLPLVSYAENASDAEGIEVLIQTDKSNYTADEIISATVTVTNRNYYTIESLQLQLVVPEGLTLVDESLATQTIRLEPGESLQLQAVNLTQEKPTEETIPSTEAPETTEETPGDNESNRLFLFNLTKEDFANGRWLYTLTHLDLISYIILLLGVVAIIALACLIVHKLRYSAIGFLCCVLCAALMFSALPIGVFAEEAAPGQDAAETEEDALEVTYETKSLTAQGQTSFVIDSEAYDLTAVVTWTIQVEKLSNTLEELFGTDPEKDDTDGDFLSDYNEIFIFATDPTLPDTDGNGINDGDEDIDGDGLSNLDELQIGTNPVSADTDKDSLTDKEEIDLHKTNPLEYDTDKDTLGDGDELLLGLDPLNPITDGTTPDGDRLFEQTVSTDNIDSSLLEEGNKAVPSLSITTSGNANHSTVIEITASTEFNDSRAIVGEAIDISSGEFAEATLSFAVSDPAPDIADTHLICKYNEDGSIEYLATEYDAESGNLSADINEAGTYYVLDVKTLFNELGLTFPTAATFRRSGRSVEVTPPIVTMAQADVVFIIDTTGSMSDEIRNVKNNIGYFVDALKEKGISAGLALIDYQDINYDGYDSTRVHKNDSSNWFYDLDAYKNAISNLNLGDGGDTPESAVDALETARLLDMRASAGKVFVLVTDANYWDSNRYGIPSMSDEIDLLINAGVTCSVVTSSSYQNTYRDLYERTNGIYVNIYGNFYTELMAIAEKVSEDLVGDGCWIYLNGPIPTPVRLDEAPYEGSTVDTDGDGIPDVEELKSVEPYGLIDLDALLTAVSRGVITGTNYGIVMGYDYNSNPILADTDFDGTEDKEDNLPKDSTFKGILHSGHGDIDVSFTVNYEYLLSGNNTLYNRNLSILSSLLAADVYNADKDGVYTYMEITDGPRKGGQKDSNTAFASLLGMDHVSYIPVGAEPGTNIYSDDVTDFLVGCKEYIYNGDTHTIIIVSIRGTNGTYEEWSSNFDVGADSDDYYDRVGNYDIWENKENHKGFDVTANRVMIELNKFIATKVNPDSKKSILITGHSRGAAIANLIGKHFEDLEDYRSYTYTFAAPYCTTDSNYADYNTIFNIKNEDDMIPYLPLESWGFHNYGKIKSISISQYYEDSNPIGNKEGTWEWLMGHDYNPQSQKHMESTLASLAALITPSSNAMTNRIKLYQLDTTENGRVIEDNRLAMSRKAAETELTRLDGLLSEERMRKFCKLEIVEEIAGLCHVEINYCPAYLLQNLANLAGAPDKSTKLKHISRDLKGMYSTARLNFATSYLDLTGGMTDPHIPQSYYLIAYNNVSALNARGGGGAR